MKNFINLTSMSTILCLSFVALSPISALASSETEPTAKATNEKTQMPISKDENLSNNTTFVSKQVNTDKPFNLAAITSGENSLDDQEMYIRLVEKGKLSDWVQLKQQEDLKNGKNKKINNFSEPIISNKATGYQIKIVSHSNVLPENPEIVTINSKTTENKSLSKKIRNVSNNNKPDIVSRAQWGADETKMNWDPEEINDLKATTITHTVTTNNYTEETTKDEINAIYNYHASVLDWGDIGFHFLVSNFGKIFEGRTGSIAGLNVAAHTYGFNKTSLGIAALGNFEPNVAGIPATSPSDELLSSMANVISWKLGQYNVKTEGKVTLTHSGNGSTKTVDVIHGQKDLQSTLSPGKYLYEKLPQIRQMVNNTNR